MPLNISEQNTQYKSVIHPLFTLSLFLAFTFFQLILNFHPSNTSVLGATSQLNPTDIIALTNLERQQHGLEPLHPNEKLAQAAQTKAQDMYLHDYWDHYSPSKNPPWTFILNAGYDYHYAGENLAKDYSDPVQLLKAWMNSPAHKENILNAQYQEVGIAVVTGTLKDKETVLIVQMFGTQFTPADYTKALERQTSAAAGVEQSRSTFTTTQSFFSNKFLATKIFTIATLIMIFFYIGFQIGRPSSHQDHHKHQLRQQHWGHLLLIVTLGILAWITRDGNIL